MGTAKGGPLPLILILHLFAVCKLMPPALASGCRIFNFGDSNSDTGGLKAGVGFPMGPPHGYLFFGRSTGRWSDGRLYIDFLCESLNMSFLSPYMEALGSDFTFGANFAVAGAATQPRTVPFSLYIQVQQFQHFKNRTKELIDMGARHLIEEEGFGKAIYSIDIGQNDISTAFYSNLSYSEVVESIPPVLSEIESAIETLYANGARKFLVYNTGPFGCIPQTLARNNIKDGRDLDPNGCLITFNNAAKAFNAGLRALCDKLRVQLNKATIVHVDMYAIKYDLVANHTEYGFERPLMACCGYGGPPYNYKVRMTCGQPNTNICKKGSRFISWDGVHYTEAANALIASNIISAAYSTPAIKLDCLCSA